MGRLMGLVAFVGALLFVFTGGAGVLLGHAQTDSLAHGGFSAEGNGAQPNLVPGAGASTGGLPAAQALDPVYDFGTVYAGQVVKHTFRLKNAGTAPLIISGVQTSCGCTAARPTRSRVPPGEESDIAVSFDTQADHGPATRTITVVTNDHSHERLSFTIHGDVKLQVKAAPALVIFDKFKQGARQSRRVVISDEMPDRNFTVGPITHTNSDIKVVSQPLAKGRGALLTITVLKTAPAGPLTDLVKVTTSRAPVEIPVSGTILGDLSVNPAQVSFGVVAHHASALRIVRLTNSGQRPVNVTGITSNNGSVTAEVEPVTAGREYKITVQLRPNTPDGVLHGVVAVRTDDPHQQDVEIPFYGIVGSFRS